MHLADDSVGLQLGTGLWQALEHHGAYSGQRQFAGQQQAVGPGPDDDDICVR